MGASESKLALKKHIFELNSRRGIPHNDPIWTALWTLPEQVDDVFQLWSPNDIANLTHSKERRPQGVQAEPDKNFETLVYVLVARLRLLQTTQIHADDQQTKNKEILNCMRTMTRVIPFAFGAPHLCQWLHRFLWLPRRPAFLRDNWPNGPIKFFDGLDPTTEYSGEDCWEPIGPPLGETILDLMVKFCFFPGFTIPKRQDEDGNPTLDTAIRVWTSGIGNSRPQGSTKENERNQQETSRLLICLMSQVMYTSPWEVATTDIKPLTYMTTKLPQRSVNGLLCSLLNTVLKYNPGLWSTPAEVVVRAHENRKQLVTNCLHLILVLTIYEPPPDAIQNQFRRALSQLHRPNDFQFIQAGVNQALTHPISTAVNPYYSFSKEKPIPWAPELIAFLWEFVQCNKRFRRYLIDTSRILDYVIILLYHAIDSKDDPSKQGVLRMCIYVLQTLSTEDKFAQQLNTWFRHPETLPPVMRIANFHGSYVDFLICSIHSILMTAKGGLEPRFDSLYPALLAILKNIAPHAKNLQRATSTKLMDISQKFLAPGYLLRNDSNNRLLLELMEVLNAIVENHVAENRRFVEVLVANKKRFKSLQEYNIDGALAELDRLAQQRKDRGEDALSINSPLSGSRPASFESARGPPPAASARSSSLGDVPENDRFAIGDDDDDQEDDGGESEEDEETPQASSTTATSNLAEGTSSPRLSEKARGKQPATTTVSIASASSRTPSTTSIPSLSNNNLTQNTSNTTSETTSAFRPTQDWLDTWLPRLQSQVHTLLQAIELAEKKQIHFVETAPRISNGDFSSSVAQEKRSAATPPAPNSYPKEAFQWTPIAIGWYTALIWSRIYLSEAEAFQGSGGIYSSTNILLFKRSATTQEISLRSPKGAIDAVGNSLAQRISSISMK
ncbi:hypothetical protein M409DRAFT_35897 [Zasmidium cellare ATCC 36951]|uniref:Uncharacterized protein n=1 Tax=Zasmidium cellare ATCC 36951 TaxID=1080233 RepID=A0A6A6CY15_ZASCE|nr:uncharacterized protein M409DRAFT_35897 [Zasmidium cellare ATCC 36951]KAF2171088.1 hypothetical protein M409DRAFT_35897 [Zasmidium cellare ATCC 36951]